MCEYDKFVRYANNRVINECSADGSCDFSLQTKDEDENVLETLTWKLCDWHARDTLANASGMAELSSRKPPPGIVLVED